jgi:uncharacterized protein YndB with AHSA1/START domain
MLLPGRNEPKFVSGHYCRIDAPRTLSFTWAWEPPDGDVCETQVTLEFHARGETTNLVLMHDRFREVSRRNNHAQGWQGCLHRLARKLGG